MRVAEETSADVKAELKRMMGRQLVATRTSKEQCHGDQLTLLEEERRGGDNLDKRER
jgi:hypothetical protein